MKSIKEIYKVGPRPSSTHTLAAERACLLYKEHFPKAESFLVNLFKSLALTAEGHHTKEIVTTSFKPKNVEIILNQNDWKYPYATALEIVGYDKDGLKLEQWDVASIGGGSIKIIGNDFGFEDDIYPHTTFDQVKSYVK